MSEQHEEKTKEEKTLRELVEDLYDNITKFNARFQTIDESNARRDEMLIKITDFQTKQEEINVRRDHAFAKQDEINKRQEISLSAINQDLSILKDAQIGDSAILKKLARLWLTDDPEIQGNDGPKPKSHAIGTWSGWKLLAGFFTILGGLVIFYQILIPALLAVHHAIMGIHVGA